MTDTLETTMNAYEMKQEARRQRLLGRADKLDRIATARYKAARAIGDNIPFGQPILVGHHSEGRHRSDLKKIDNNMRKSFEATEAAKRARGKAHGMQYAGISSDDPDAPDKIKEKIAKLEALQATMTAVNKVVRAFYKHGNRAENSDDDLARYFEKMAEAGVNKAHARELLHPSWGTHVGFEAYQMSNNNANIRRYKDRLAQVERNAQREHKETPIGNSGVTLVENVEINRLQLVFPGKPAAEVRTKLKQSGFRWSPTEGAWQRQLSNSAKYAAQEIVKAL